MQSEHYDELEALDQSYWWFNVRYDYAWRLVRRAAGPTPGFLVDVGCGTAGFLVKVLQTRGLPAASVMGIEGSEQAVAVGRRRGVPVLRADLGEIRSATLPRPPDVITLLDVLEHLPRPVPVLRDLRSICRPGGHAIILVPALKRLWSKWDDVLGHHRRYDRRTLRAELTDAGWRVVSMRYLFATLVVPAYLRDRLLRRSIEASQFQRVPSLVNRLLTSVFIAETYLPPLPFGTSLAALAVNDGPGAPV